MFFKSTTEKIAQEWASKPYEINGLLPRFIASIATDPSYMKILSRHSMDVDQLADMMGDLSSGVFWVEVAAAVADKEYLDALLSRVKAKKFSMEEEGFRILERSS